MASASPSLATMPSTEPTRLVSPATQPGFAAELTAAKKGDMKAMVKVGEAYAHGKGVGLNRNQAAAWFEKAAEVGIQGRCTCLVSRIVVAGA